MDEEELEGLLPRTDLDNASQGTVSTQDALLGTPINAPAGVGAPSDKVSIPSFGQPGAGVMPAMPAMPTVDQVAPAVETYGDYFPPVTTLESQPLSPSQEADLFGSKALDDAIRNGGLKETELVKMVPSDPLTEQEKMSLAQPIDTQPLSESEKADLLEMQGLDNLRQNGADTLMGALEFPDSGLDRILPSEPLTANESSDLFAQQRMDEMRQNGPQNLAEALGPPTSNGAIPLPELTRESSQFEGSAIMPDGSTKGYLVGGGSRTMSPEEISAFETARKDGTANQYSVPMGEYQNVPGTQGSVSLPLPAPAPAPAPATEQPAVPAEQADSILDSENLPTSDLVRLNPRALTTADVENPALDGMSAAEKIAAVNTPGYQSPDLAPIPAGGRPQSKFDQFSENYTDFYANMLDLPLSLGRAVVSPLLMTKDYLLGTEDNKNPTLRELGSERYDAITENPIGDFVSGRRAQEKAGQAASEQDQRNRDFFAQNPGAQYRDGIKVRQSTPLTPEEMNDFMGAEGSPQRYFMDKVAQGPLTDQEIAAGYQFAERNGFNFNPDSGFSKRPAFSTGPATPPPAFSTGPGNIDPRFGGSGQIPGGVQDMLYRNPGPGRVQDMLYRNPPSNINDYLNRNPYSGVRDMLYRNPVPTIANKPALARPDNYGVRPLPQGVDPNSFNRIQYNTPSTLENYRSRGQTLGQFMRYEDEPSQRTEQFVDNQGRLRRRLTAEAASRQGYSPQEIARNRPLAPEYREAEANADRMIADLRARERGGNQSSTAMAAPSGGRQASIADKQGGYSDGDLRKIFGRGKKLQRAKALAQNGIDPVTMKPFSETASSSRQDSLKERILAAEAEAKERGEDPAEVRQRILNNQLLEERINELRRKGLPEDITFRKGEFGTIVVQKGGRDISYFKEDVDLEEQMRRLGNLPGGARQEFGTMEEAEAANLPKGTKITIGGRNATV